MVVFVGYLFFSMGYGFHNVQLGYQSNQQIIQYSDHCCVLPRSA